MQKCVVEKDFKNIIAINIFMKNKQQKLKKSVPMNVIMTKRKDKI